MKKITEKLIESVGFKYDDISEHWEFIIDKNIYFTISKQGGSSLNSTWYFTRIIKGKAIGMLAINTPEALITAIFTHGKSVGEKEKDESIANILGIKIG